MSMQEEQPLGRMIYFIAQDIRNLAERVLAPYDLTLEQFQTLKALSPTRGMTQRQLGREIKKNPANMTRILDRMEAKALTVRQANPADRRAYLVLLTERGRVLLDEVKVVFDQFSAAVHKGLTDEMKRTTRKALGVMAANVEKMADSARQERK